MGVLAARSASVPCAQCLSTASGVNSESMKILRLSTNAYRQARAGSKQLRHTKNCPGTIVLSSTLLLTPPSPDGLTTTDLFPLLGGFCIRRAGWAWVALRTGLVQSIAQYQVWLKPVLGNILGWG